MRLPGSAQDIAEVIGRDRALYLIGKLPRCFAGYEGRKSQRVIMYVPKTLKPDHQLVEILGWHDARRLVAAFGGEILNPPTCQSIYLPFRARSIVQLVSDGIPEKEVADMMGVSVRRVRDLVRENAKEDAQPANDNNVPESTLRGVSA